MPKIGTDLKIVILAAGKGKRLESLGLDLPKPLIPIQGRPMIAHLIEAVREAAVDSDPIIVTAPDNREVFCRQLGETTCRFVVQEKQLGTGHAVICAMPAFNNAKHVMVLNGDHPTVTAQTIRRLAEAHKSSGAILTMATVKFPDFNDWRQWFYNFGRVIRSQDGEISRIVELKDATEEERAVTEVNPAYMIFRRDWLCAYAITLTNKNQPGEYYLTDLVQLAVDQGQKIHSIVVENPIEAIGINTPEQLKAAEEALSGSRN